MRWFLGILTMAAFAAMVLGVVTTERSVPSLTEVWGIPEAAPGNLDEAFRLAPNWVIQPTGHVSAGVAPHHALVSPIIAAWFVGLKNQPAPDTVVILGPDHNNSGAGYVTTALADWQTPDGLVRVNKRLVLSLVEKGDAVIDPKRIRTEHGVYTAIPYIRRVWPRTTIVTLAFKGDLRSDRLQRLARDLDLVLGRNDLVFATVDFSHYQTSISALTEDEKSLAVIKSGDAEAALKIPVDSPPAISLLLRYQHLRQLQYQQLAHTTSGEYTGRPSADSTTSYVSAYYLR